MKSPTYNLYTSRESLDYRIRRFSYSEAADEEHPLRRGSSFKDLFNITVVILDTADYNGFC